MNTRVRQCFLLFAMSLIVQNCISIKNTPRSNLTVLEKFDYKKLNGSYNNKANSDSVSRGFNRHDHLWDLLGNARAQNIRGIYYDTCTVKIQFITPNKANISLVRLNTIIKTKTIRGRFKMGYFYLHRRLHLIPFFPILFYYSDNLCRIGLLGTDLVVDYSGHGVAVMIIGADSWQEGSKRYIKLE